MAHSYFCFRPVLCLAIILSLAGAWSPARGAGAAMSFQATQLSKQIQQQQGEARLQAIIDLGHTGDPSALPILLRLLYEKDPLPGPTGELDPASRAFNIRAAVVQGLRWIRDPQAAAILLPALREPSPHVRAEALDSLVFICDDTTGWYPREQAIPLVQNALRDNDADVRAAALDALARLQETKAADALLAGLTDPETVVRAQAILSLGRLKYSKAQPQIQAALHDPEAAVRIAAIQALILLHTAEHPVKPQTELDDDDARAHTIAALVGAMRDDDARVRTAAADAVWWNCDEPQTQSTLLGLLDDSTAEVRVAAARALGATRNTHIREALQRTLEDKNALVRATAAVALARSRDAAVIPPVLDAVRAKKKWVYAGVDYAWMVADALALPGLAAEPALIAALKDPNVYVREQAVNALARIGDPRTLDPLCTALQDEDATIRRQAAKALAGLGDTRAVPGLIAALKDVLPIVRWDVADALGTLNDKRAIDPLITLMQSDRSDECKHAVWALGNLADNEKGLIALVTSAQNDTRDKRLAAIWGLGKVHDARAVPYLLEILAPTPLTDQDDPPAPPRDVQLAIVAALGDLGSPTAVPVLITQLGKSNDIELRNAIVAALTKIRDRRAVPTLAKLLQDSIPEVRWQALWGLYAMKDPRTQSVLLNAMQDEQRDPTDRAIAARALARLGDDRSWAAVVAVVRHPNTQLAVAAITALADGAPQNDISQPLLDALDDPRPAIKATAVMMAGKLKLPRTTPVLLRLLPQADSPLRAALITALGDQGAPPSVPVLTTLLTDGDAGLRALAITALAKIGDKSVVPALLPLLKETDPMVRAAAITTLGTLGDNQAFTPLQLAYAAETDDAARMLLLTALGRLPVPTDVAVDAALVALHAPDWRLNVAAAQALGNWKSTRAIPDLIRLLRDDLLPLRTTAATALHAITNQDLGADPAAWEKWKKE